jgi:multiple sugar transport system permease protein
MRRTLGRIGIYAVAVVVLLMFLAPIGWIAVLSLKTRAQIFAWPPQIWGFAPTLENYRGLFTGNVAFPRAILNSLIAAVGSTALALVVGLPAAYALVGQRLRNAASVRSGVLLFRMIPPVALLLPYYLLFRLVGLLGSLVAVAVVHFTFSIAIVVWMMRGSFGSLPSEIEEAGRIDGASRWQLFLFISLPMTTAAVAASAIFALLTSWNEFLFAITLSKLQTQTIPVAVVGFGDVYTSWGQLAAATIVGLLPSLALAFLGQRWLLTGMAPGGVK